MAKKAAKKTTTGKALPKNVRKAFDIWSAFLCWVESPTMYTDIDKRRAGLAYQGSKPRERALDTLKGKARENSSLESFLRNARLPFSSASANDGEIIRVFDALGNEVSRFFISKRGKQMERAILSIYQS